MTENVQKRECSFEKSSTLRGYCDKTICLPFDQTTYDDVLHDNTMFRNYLDFLIQEHSELFPSDITSGYWLHDFCRPSKKMNGFQMRQIISV